jgi:hypothetical protein
MAAGQPRCFIPVCFRSPRSPGIFSATNLAHVHSQVLGFDFTFTGNFTAGDAFVVHALKRALCPATSYCAHKDEEDNGGDSGKDETGGGPDWEAGVCSCGMMEDRGKV